MVVGYSVNQYGTREWTQDGLLHKEDGPAIIHADGMRIWCRRNRLHREDGPACTWPDGRREWWINDVNISEEVELWLMDQNITWPFDRDALLLFQLRWVHNGNN